MLITIFKLQDQKKFLKEQKIQKIYKNQICKLKVMGAQYIFCYQTTFPQFSLKIYSLNTLIFFNLKEKKGLLVNQAFQQISIFLIKLKDVLNFAKAQLVLKT
ncbi:hypothetical protein TTHERM_000571689 (macronuclear) [Tetrahymena thermophila SB210]|uniref:Uncharacterized protein n=1 Tax=Tetrahymena thermophila (strain SB210) TaxID=312017 RepID=W7WZF2_TETTS|nr:hypothetical protein TTHERM_000571689 [Tetrahymena thermophila SB210]EWS72280.1 hypothetical protein TTHERM_000571689 [Tetrahymena thermophila SB210]|eukprot:XP_012655220.1 hypothetical protein TTHERM_000571689 [Tetrahymena thermophila SB210]